MWRQCGSQRVGRERRQVLSVGALGCGVLGGGVLGGGTLVVRGGLVVRGDRQLVLGGPWLLACCSILFRIRSSGAGNSRERQKGEGWARLVSFGRATDFGAPAKVVHNEVVSGSGKSG